ncbi:MAG: WD40/YVTN/BNR-like repeat-containing protein [Anaerolineae bacterium]
MKIRWLFLILTLSLTSCGGQPSPVVTQPADQTPPTPAPVIATSTPALASFPQVTAPALFNLQMFTEQEGWGVTETALLRTSDGGQTWFDLTPPGLNPVGYAVNPFFLDLFHAWVLVPTGNGSQQNGNLYRTSDGGLHWASNAVPFGGGRLVFLDDSRGWMLADLGVGAGSNAVAIFQTIDGGATWTQTYINDPTVPGAGDSLPLGGLKFGLTPLDMQTAWVWGVTYAPGRAYLFRTDDGGHTWTPVTLPLPPQGENAELSIEAMRFFGSTGFLAMRLTAEQNQLAIYVSQDGGTGWILAPTLLPNGGMTQFLSAQEAVVYNGDQFYVTRDAAQTWVTVAPNIVFAENFALMDFIHPQIGWVVTADITGQRLLYHSTDGGATWNLLSPQP